MYQCSLYGCREKYWQIQPLKQGQHADYRDSADVDKAPEVHLTSLNHASLEAADPAALSKFYTRVLGFSSLTRPDFPFDGAWLEGAGLLLHIIQEDPSVPKRFRSWKVKSFPLHLQTQRHWNHSKSMFASKLVIPLYCIQFDKNT